MALEKKELLNDVIRHVDITKIDATSIIDAMRGMSFSSRDTASAADILQLMINDSGSTNWLVLAGSTGAGGCLQVFSDMVRFKMIDCVVATGASIIDMDFFEALGYKHYKGTPYIDDRQLRQCYIDRIYDTFIDEEELQHCDRAIKAIADTLDSRPYSSREFLRETGRWLTQHAVKKNSLIQTCYEHEVPIFVPAFSDCSAGFGLVMHQWERIKEKKAYLTIDSVADFRELTQIKLAAQTSGLFMVGGGVPKNFAQDTVVCAECLGYDVPMHRYAVQITVADPRDGACSSSTLKEASSWGKVDTVHEQMVYAEATTVVPLIVSYAYHKGDWQQRKKYAWATLFD
ncbi:MAG: deoxyhypusine synthase [Prevotellaceae bacterium]|jgi:deoxyhypusine synthase|nr:deoxyhypusine synthase [Prevotellaceae bacterium]